MSAQAWKVPDSIPRHVDLEKKLVYRCTGRMPPDIILTVFQKLKSYPHFNGSLIELQ